MMDYKSFKAKYNLRLTEQQEKAVKKVNGPTLLLAVPGSGKTTVLISRLGYMVIALGIRPERILTVTYTVAATKDMRNRFNEKFGSETGDLLEFRTINGLCAKIIHTYAEMTGQTEFQLVTDEKYILGMLSRIVRSIGDGNDGIPQESDVRKLRSAITYIKNMLLTPEDVRRMEKDVGHNLYEVYETYRRIMREQKLMDYDDQMYYTYRLLSNPQICSYFQKDYDYICVDEGQDTSLIQHKIIGLLAGERDNLFMVGDEDQSIYGYRAAYPEALLTFEKEHKGATVLLMEENFRSDAAIVQAANDFIQKNRMRHKKILMTNRGSETPITCIKVDQRMDQFDLISELPKYLTETTAVLFRENESMIPLVDRLVEKNLPFQLRNAELNFFTDKTVFDIRDFLRISLDPNDVEAFRNIYYKMGVPISKEQYKTIVHTLRNRMRGASVLDAAEYLFQGDADILKAITVLRGLRNRSASLALEDIYHVLNYEDYMNKRNINPTKFITAQQIARRQSSVVGFLNRLQTLQRIISKRESDLGAKLILSTIHASKGLEYDTVYLLDQFDQVTRLQKPNPESRTYQEDVRTYEEERRIFYVAVTRAKNRLVVFTNEWLDSMFVDELIRGRNTLSSTPKLTLMRLRGEWEKEQKQKEVPEPIPETVTRREEKVAPATPMVGSYQTSIAFSGAF